MQEETGRYIGIDTKIYDKVVHWFEVIGKVP